MGDLTKIVLGVLTLIVLFAALKFPLPRYWQDEDQDEDRPPK